MHIKLSVILTFVNIFTLAPCGGNNSDGFISNESNATVTKSSEGKTAASIEKHQETSQDYTVDRGAEDAKIKLTFDRVEIIVNLYFNIEVKLGDLFPVEYRGEVAASSFISRVRSRLHSLLDLSART